jgi:hypothetical protein
MRQVPPRPTRPWRVGPVFSLALLLAFALFAVHATVLFDIALFTSNHHQELVDRMGPHRAGRLIVVGCFSLLFVTHMGEAAVWGVFLRVTGLMRTFMEGVYFAGVTITALGYGDVVLAPPWRMLAPIIAVTGVLKFGCSTAFLFLVMQIVWAQHLF